MWPQVPSSNRFRCCLARSEPVMTVTSAAEPRASSSPNGHAPGQSPSRPAQSGPDAAHHKLQKRARELLQIRRKLPVWAAGTALGEHLHAHPTLILVGETGSGKTTQAPQMALHFLAPRGLVVCTQPRRVAAITVAQRVAAEQGCVVGGRVGYSVRFDDCTSADTRIKYMTDGMLIREAIVDPKLRQISVVFVDEAHERTVNTDVLLGLLKRAQQARFASNHPLKIIVMSATLEQADFVSFFPGAVPAYVQGRQHPVDVLYTREPQASYSRAIVNAILQVSSSRHASVSSQIASRCSCHGTPGRRGSHLPVLCRYTWTSLKVPYSHF